MATLTLTISGSGTTQQATIQSSDFGGASGDQFVLYQDAVAGTTAHLGVSGIGTWYHGAYSTTTNLVGPYDTSNQNGGLWTWDNNSENQTSASTTFAVPSGYPLAGTAGQAFVVLQSQGGSYNNFWGAWANGRHVATKKASSNTVVYAGTNILSAAGTATGDSSDVRGIVSGAHLGLAVASASAAAPMNVAFSNGTYTDSVTYAYIFTGQITATGGTAYSTLLLLNGYDNALTTTLRDAIAADYRTHGGASNVLSVTTGSKTTSGTDLYGTASTAWTDGFDPQRAAYILATSSNHVNLGGTTAAAWGIDGTTVTARFSPAYIITGWTDTASTPTVKYGTTALVSGTDFVAYNDTANHILYLCLLSDIGSGGVRFSSNISGLAALDVTAGSGGTTTNTLTVSDSLTVADSLTAGVGVTAGDALTVGESTSASGGFTAADTAALVDLLSAALTVKLSDTLTLSDALSAILGVLALNDTLTLTDAATIIGQALLVASDSLTPTDTLAAVLGPVLGDSITSADSLSASQVSSQSDRLTLSDVLAATQTGTWSDQASIADALMGALGLTGGDALAVAEALSALLGYTSLDNLTLAEAATIVAQSGVTTAYLSATDTLTPVDALQASQAVTLTDSLLFAEALAAAIQVAFADRLTLAEALTVASTTTALLVLTDQLSVVDQLTAAAGFLASDQLSAVDALAALLRPVLADALTLSDLATLAGQSVTGQPSIALAFKAIARLLAFQTQARTLAYQTLQRTLAFRTTGVADMPVEQVNPTTQPLEVHSDDQERRCTVDFSNSMGTGESVVSGVALVKALPGLLQNGVWVPLPGATETDVTASVVPNATQSPTPATLLAGNVLEVLLGPGFVAGQIYRVYFRATTNASPAQVIGERTLPFACTY